MVKSGASWVGEVLHRSPLLSPCSNRGEKPCLREVQCGTMPFDDPAPHAEAFSTRRSREPCHPGSAEFLAITIQLDDRLWHRVLLCLYL